MEKFSFKFDSFYLLDKTVSLKETGLKIELKNENEEIIKLIFGLAHTPRTYYSGWKPIVTMGVEVPNSKHFIEKEFGINGSNADAESEARAWKPLLRLPSWGSSCTAYKVFNDEIIENELCKISGMVPDNSKYEISVAKAEKEEYVQVMTSLELMPLERDGLLFSGWKRPDNLLETGEWEVKKNSKYEVLYALKKSSSISDEEVSGLIEGHLERLGY